MVADCLRKLSKRGKKCKQPLCKATPNMMRRTIRLLTIGKAHHSFRSVAKLLEITKNTVRHHMEDQEIKFSRKIKLNLISKAQQEVRRKCRMRLRKTFRQFTFQT
jgi:ribosomal protein L31E